MYMKRLRGCACQSESIPESPFNLCKLKDLFCGGTEFALKLYGLQLLIMLTTFRYLFLPTVKVE